MAPIRALRLSAGGIPLLRTGEGYTESLVSAEDFGVAGRAFYAHSRNPPYWAPAPGAPRSLLIRKGVAERLRGVNERLATQGLKLFLFDAWRPRAVQAHFHDEWAPREIGKRRPDLVGEALAAEVDKYWAAPSADEDHPAPHATGGAVDITIMWDDGEALFMGSLFDDASAISHADRFERIDGADFSFSAEEAQANRRILYWTMIEAGFANHPNEWWHFSHGDQAWAAQTGAPAALYGLARPD